MNTRLLTITGTLTACPRFPWDWRWFWRHAPVALPAALLAGVWCGSLLAVVR